MARPDRLFRLLDALRRLPAPVTARRLAEETGVSVRSVYRDIDSLRAAGAEIGGERGFGYCLVEDGSLPPQMFDRLEIEALVLGMGRVAHAGDPALVGAAASVLAKLAATLPQARQQQLVHAVSMVHRFDDEPAPPLPDMALLREACWREEAVAIRYVRDGETTERTIWPLAIVYLSRSLMVLSRCCLRNDFRMFRADRIHAVKRTGESFRPRRVALLRAYIAEMAARRQIPPCDATTALASEAAACATAARAALSRTPPTR
ncbi:YafY family protein [uncultured Xylophilus sp.]|uniref:helix-turn-helix transcriptional regulator n=1 Tax=uncultured Xylophilus sp. TaxID=296832 RepID=UPI0025DF1F5A|nr:YafY family protein [uncultured Xylophilus sp.]